MQFLMIFVVAMAVAARGAPSHNIVTPVILPKVHLASPDVTVVKQPYVIQQTEPVFRHVYYADPLSLPVPYVSHHVAYHQPPAATAAVYHHSPYAPAVNYIV
ncbi:Hypothetical protein CINCED_3A019350 [Cinara cedri]|uniref:Uncharacterized protein n=1 Tax=Cinara cedri TaxID=506608 RepID=A0A5E4NIW5_9HEMI|nr:Hypothetical protein CINCED_3A019350 [Cinara cedri]